MTDSASDGATLPLETTRRIHQQCERFELEWQSPNRPKLKAFLDGSVEPERSTLMAELLALELELRNSAGEHVAAEEYECLFPDEGDRNVIASVFRHHRDFEIDPEPLTVSMPGRDGTAKSSRRTPPVPKIDGYEILGVLGRGGMGVVYKARDLRLKRLVALKMILSGEHASPQLLARFRREAELVARLQHPNIVQIFDVGDADGHPFIAFEFIEGKTLADTIHRDPQPPRIAAELLESMAHAAHYAHQQGIVHRDLKPANILMQGSGASGQGTGDTPTSSISSQATSSGPQNSVPKITDFGLAKDLVNAGDHSTTGAILGTPNYMSPEQAEGKVHEIGPASDIYSLGAILYTLLTGRPPFQGTTAIETISMVVKSEPIAPTQFQPRLPRDLETICLKCLQKDPARRYTTAGALADDLRRFLNHETILARPSGYVEKTWRMCRRNPVTAGLITAVFAVLVAGVAVSTNYAFIAKREADTAREEKTRAETIAQRARERAYLADVRSIQSAWDENTLGSVYDLLHAQHPDQTDGIDLRQFEWHYWNRMANTGSRLVGRHDTGVKSICVGPNGKHIASAGRDATIRIWEIGQEKERIILTGHVGEVNSVCFHPDGERVVSAGDDSTLRIWSIKSGAELQRLTGHAGPVHCVCTSINGEWIASGGQDQSLKIWNAATGVEAFKFAHPSPVGGVAFSPDSTRIVSGAEDHHARVWSIATGLVTHTLSGHSNRLRGVAFSPDGTTIATCSQDSTSKLWDATTGTLRHTLTGHRWDIWTLAFSPDGKRLVTDNFDRTLKMWNTETGRLEQTFKGHLFSVVSVAFHPDGQSIISGSEDGTVRIWDAPADYQNRVRLRHQSKVWFLACSHDGRWLASAGGITDKDDTRLPQGELFLWDRHNGMALRKLPGHTTSVGCVTFSPDGRVLASAGSTWDAANKLSTGGVVLLHDPVSGQLQATLPGHASRVLSMVFSPDGQWLATGGTAGDILVRRLPDGKESFALTGLTKEITTLAFSPDGRSLAAGSFDSIVKVWDIGTRAEKVSLTAATRISAVAWAPGGAQLAVADYNIDVRLHNTITWEIEKKLRGHSGGVTSLAYSPDGRRIATGSEDKSVKLWDRASGQELLTFNGHDDLIRSVCFSPDGQVLYSTGWDRTIRIWDSTPLK